MQNPFDYDSLPVSLNGDGDRAVNSAAPGNGLGKLFALIVAMIAATFRAVKVIDASATMTRPADTTAYASGDLVANSTTAGSVVPFTLNLARVSAGTVLIKRVRLKKSGTSSTNAAFRVHLFGGAAPTVSNGDNAAFVPLITNYLGSFDVTAMVTGSNGAAGQGVALVGTEIAAVPATNSRAIYALLEARGAYTPASEEVFTLTAEVVQEG